MKYTKIKSLILVLVLTCSLLGCGQDITLSDLYSNYNFTLDENSEPNYINTDIDSQFFANDLCVSDQTDVNADAINNLYVGAGGIFDLNEKEVLYGYHLFEKRYPASTTKIMTALLTIKHCDLDELVSVSENAVDMPSGAVTCGINVGDVLTVKDLLYALMLPSANDAAVALAEHIAGSVEEFSKLMNEEAKRLGATGTNFVNPNGLHSDEHYTTVYDMYLIFNEAIKYDLFCEIVNTRTYTATYQSVRGSQVQKTYSTSNSFLSGEEEYPENFTLIGGKTGTTHDAGKCLVLYVKDESGNGYILIGFGCDTREILYNYMASEMEYINEVK